MRLCYDLNGFVCTVIFLFVVSRSQFDWIKRDRLNEIFDAIDAVNADNCGEKDLSELVLPYESVYKKPSLRSFKESFIWRNRTAMLHTRNIAHRNAILFSLLLQDSSDYDEPGLMYMYLRLSTDITSGEGFINGSSLIYDKDCHYAVWLKDFFNKTIPLFGLKAWRYDDFFEPFNWRMCSTNNTIQVLDLGVNTEFAYDTSPLKRNEWYSMWLPDIKRFNHRNGKAVYSCSFYTAKSLGVLYDSEERIEFYGPPHPEDESGPTKWTRPYFDCGKSNKWIVSSVAPVVDIIPRHTEYRHLQVYRYLAVAVADIDFLSIDINQCDEREHTSKTAQNIEVEINIFASTHKCKPSTRCEPLVGFGFRRGGYQCSCKPGFHYPPTQNGPFKGLLIERATEEEYKENFDCIPVHLSQRVPLSVAKVNEEIFSDLQIFEHQIATAKPVDIHKGAVRLFEIFSKYSFFAKNPELCVTETEEGLSLRWDVMYDVDVQFEAQSSSFQLINENEDFPHRRNEKIITVRQIYAELVATLASDQKIAGIGVMFDRSKLKAHYLPFFGPYAFRSAALPHHYNVLDFAGKKEGYHNKIWFKSMQERWRNDVPKNELDEFFLKFLVRSNTDSDSAQMHESGYPLRYYAPKVSGVVRVDVYLENLDVNQCDAPFHVANAFKNTHHCDKTSTCVNVEGRGFISGYYKCECKPGFEYPYLDQNNYFSGKQIEKEWNLKVKGSNSSRLDTLKCRISFSYSVRYKVWTIISTVLFYGIT